MPLYDFVCPACDHLQEEFQGMNDRRTATCEMCGSLSCWSPTTVAGLTIIGDTCSGSMNYTGYDPVLKTEIHGRSHRKRVMKEQGLKEYNPNPEIKAARDEAKYMRRHAPPRDSEARIAGGKLVFSAQDKVVKKQISDNIDKTYKKVQIKGV